MSALMVGQIPPCPSLAGSVTADLFMLFMQ
jgi:hypothetical protein